MVMRMDITDLVDSLRQDLTRAADVGGDDTRAAAERLLLALDPAMRLTLMDALSRAAAEIEDALPGVTIEVRLKGREPTFAVVGAPAAAAAPADEASFEADDGEAVARITLRIPETLKARAESLAARRGQSLNTWLVGAARAAASEGPDWSGHTRHGLPGRRMKGWAR
jgi:hypothetical protein